MMNSKQLIEGKLARIASSGDEASLAFITTLLSCQGSVYQEFGYPQGFSDYRRHWGDEKFNEVKQSLIGEGLLRETVNILAINYPDFISLDYDERRELANAWATFLFEKAERFYGCVLKDVLSTPEGEYVLAELAKVGPSLSEGNIGHVSQAVGYKYYQEISDKLSQAGLLVYESSSRRHDYFRLFPPLVPFLLLDSQEIQNALRFVYIAQSIGEDGVLQSDCGQYKEQIENLLLRGVVEERSWYNLRMFRTTLRGEAIAKPMVEARLSQAKEEMSHFLESMPPKVFRFLCQEIFGGSAHRSQQGRAVAPYFTGQWSDVSSVGEVESHLCLLNEQEIRLWRDRLFEWFRDMGLAVVVYTYVSTRGGETRERVYVLPPEVNEFLKDYADLKGYLEPLFGEDLEMRHKLYHLLSTKKERVVFYSSEHMVSEADQAGIPVAELQRTIDELIAADLMAKWEDKYVGVGDYERAIRERYLVPLARNLLESEVGARLDFIAEETQTGGLAEVGQPPAVETKRSWDELLDEFTKGV